jgi:MSHA biogenesis protein MshO
MKIRHQGFTLIEAVIVIAITGIIGGIVAVFIRAPVKGYFDSVRRAEMTDTANTALRKISRDLHLALPNSVRITGGNAILELLLTRTGGRYRIEGPGDILDFSGTDATGAFDIIGPNVTMAANDQIVIYNLGDSVAEANAYIGTNRRTFAGTPGSVSNVQFGAVNAASFPLDSPNHAFHVVEGPVTYRCDTGAGTLTRFSGYAIADPAPVALGTGRLLANNVSLCQFTYTSGITSRSGLVTMRLTIRDAATGESVTLYHQVQVSNVP